MPLTFNRKPKEWNSEHEVGERKQRTVLCAGQTLKPQEKDIHTGERGIKVKTENTHICISVDYLTTS